MINLTPKQRAFVEAYTGNATEAARLAGYKGSDKVLAQVGHENLNRPEIAEAIRARQDKENSPLIANRQARQAFWSEVMRDRAEEMPNRLKASELLGRSEADFTAKVEHSGKVTLEDLVVGLGDE